MNVDGIDMRIVDEQARAVNFFPDIPGPSMDELMISRLGSARDRQVERLAAVGMGAFAYKVPPVPNWTEHTDEADSDLLPTLRDVCGVRQGIALHKLSVDAGGWWVTGPECAAALAQWEQAGRPDIDDGDGDLIAFIRLAVAEGHDGFRVWPAA